ncbi:MAG: AAA family ATPase [Methylocella sp.]
MTIRITSLSEVQGFPRNLIARAETEFDDFQQAMREDPYQLTKVHGIGFRLADRAAMAWGIKPNAVERQRAASYYALQEAERDGHTRIPINDLAKRMKELLEVWMDSCELDDRIVEDGGYVQRMAMQSAEVEIAERLRVLAGPAKWPGDYDLEGLAPDQEAAVRLIVESGCFCLLGSPGTGKTFAVKCLATGFEGKFALCAPTGKAAKRIEQSSGLPASTIHRLLGVKEVHDGRFTFKHDDQNPLPYDLVICDEASMVDTWLLRDLLRALRDDARLLFVGDPHQLPSVGPGSVLRDLRKSHVPYIELSTLKRQNPELLIAKNCGRVRDGLDIEVANTTAQDFFFVAAASEAETAQVVTDLFCERLPKKYGLDPARDIVVLTALKERGMLATENLNVAIRKRLNPQPTPEFSVGDRVIQRSNNYDLGLMNGECGTVTVADTRTLTLETDDGERIKDRRSEFNLMFAWALTGHKAQGSEWPWVNVPVHRSMGAMIPRKQWFYTAISRGKAGVVLVGSRDDVRAIISRTQEINRCTGLAGLLNGKN